MAVCIATTMLKTSHLHFAIYQSVAGQQPYLAAVELRMLHLGDRRTLAIGRVRSMIVTCKGRERDMGMLTLGGGTNIHRKRQCSISNRNIIHTITSYKGQVQR